MVYFCVYIHSNWGGTEWATPGIKVDPRDAKMKFMPGLTIFWNRMQKTKIFRDKSYLTKSYLPPSSRKLTP